ncbi:MAG: hypothetical protein ACM3PP_04425, partial [Candidatus Saccharibacteria bacterium]
MKLDSGIITDDVRKTVDEVIQYVGKDITFGMTLALGKPIRIINEFYRRAKEDPEINLKIITALSLEKPVGKSELEARFVKSLNERIFDGVPDFDYMLDYRAGTLPPNVEIYEFFCKAGNSLDIAHAQLNHLSSNYTHVPRTAHALGTNVCGMLVAHQEIDGKHVYSAACNPDITLETLQLVKGDRAKGKKVA